MDRDCNNCIFHADRGCTKWECEGTVTIEDAEKGIRSLQSWEEVLQELEVAKEHATDLIRPKIFGMQVKELTDVCFNRAIKIINQKLAEIEEAG